MVKRIKVPMTNMRVQRRTRPALRAGDIFTLEMPQKRFWFGRVVSVDGGPVAGASILTYVYDYCSRSPEPDISSLRFDRLLLPPFFINRLAWTYGYFLNVDHRSLKNDDIPEQHCFVYTIYDPPRLVDINGAEVGECTGPIGHFSVFSYAYLDDVLSDILKIPPAEEAGR